jgi:hypothetical protein
MSPSKTAAITLVGDAAPFPTVAQVSPTISLFRRQFHYGIHYAFWRAESGSSSDCRGLGVG